MKHFKRTFVFTIATLMLVAAPVKSFAAPYDDPRREADREAAREAHGVHVPDSSSSSSDDSSYTPSYGDDSSSSSDSGSYDDSSDDSSTVSCDGESPFKSGDVKIDATALVGKVFYSTHSKGLALQFTQDGNNLVATVFKDGALKTPYDNLNCGDMDQIKGTKHGLACTRGSTEIDIAVYKTQAGSLKLNLAYDTEMEDWHNSCNQPTFYDWTQQ